MIRVLRAADRIAAPWKNGGGITREVAICRRARVSTIFDWRVSIAECARVRTVFEIREHRSHDGHSDRGYHAPPLRIAPSNSMREASLCLSPAMSRVKARHEAVLSPISM